MDRSRTPGRSAAAAHSRRGVLAHLRAREPLGQGSGRVAAALQAAMTAPLTDLVRRAKQGDASAAEELFTVMYDEFRRLAHARLKNSGRSLYLDTISLVNEWYLRFAESEGAELESRTHL